MFSCRVVGENDQLWDQLLSTPKCADVLPWLEVFSVVNLSDFQPVNPSGIFFTVSTWVVGFPFSFSSNFQIRFLGIDGTPCFVGLTSHSFCLRDSIFEKLSTSVEDQACCLRIDVFTLHPFLPFRSSPHPGLLFGHRSRWAHSSQADPYTAHHRR